MRLPVRVRLTTAFTVAMAALIVVGGAVLYEQVASSLLRTTDNALRAQASLVQAGIDNNDVNFADQGAGREGVQTFSQILGPSGRILESTEQVAAVQLVSPARLQNVSGPVFVERALPGLIGSARMLVQPVSEGNIRMFVVVGTSLAARAEVLARLLLLIAVGGPIGLAIASLAGWKVAGAALRPIERMRRQAAAISASEPGRRLPVSSSRDEIERLGTTLNAMLERIEQSFGAERRLVDHASHEFRTPLAILRAELELGLSRAATPAEMAAALRAALEEADRLAALADDLLVYSRERGGRVPLSHSVIRVDGFLESAVAPFLRQGEACGIRVEPRAVPSQVEVDAVRARQVLDNLMANALRHTPSGGTITVSGSVDGTRLTLVVEDTGPGFEEAVLEQAFEPFARGTADRAKDPAGSGLGLAIVRAVAEEHGGHAEATNRPGGGARVSVTLDASPLPLADLDARLIEP